VDSASVRAHLGGHGVLVRVLGSVLGVFEGRGGGGQQALRGIQIRLGLGGIRQCAVRVALGVLQLGPVPGKGLGGQVVGGMQLGEVGRYLVEPVLERLRRLTHKRGQGLVADEIADLGQGVARVIGERLKLLRQLPYPVRITRCGVGVHADD
jgi:hypothetical protein